MKKKYFFSFFAVFFQTCSPSHPIILCHMPGVRPTRQSRLPQAQSAFHPGKNEEDQTRGPTCQEIL